MVAVACLVYLGPSASPHFDTFNSKRRLVPTELSVLRTDLALSNRHSPSSILEAEFSKQNSQTGPVLSRAREVRASSCREFLQGAFVTTPPAVAGIPDLPLCLAA